MDVSRASARIHWLVVGPFGTSQKGRSFAVTPDDFAKALEKAQLKTVATIPDRLGSDETRTFDLSFSSLRSFTLKQTVLEQPILKALLEVAETLGKGPTPQADEVAGRVESVVGTGALSTAIRNELSPSVPESVPDATTGSLDDYLDDGVAPNPARGAVDAFVSSMRTGKKKTGVKRSAAKTVQRLIEDAVFTSASELLQTDAVQALESAWRGLKLIVDRCPSIASMFIEVLDVDLDDVEAAMAARPEVEPTEEPDAVFIMPPLGTVDQCQTFASMAESALAPFVVSADPGLFGASDMDSLAETLDGSRDESSPALDAPNAPNAWNAFRTLEVSRWLCVVTNRVALFSEGVGPAKRTCLGSGGWALAAMICASYRDTASFARVIGRPGSIHVTGTVELTGRHEGMSVPTEAFVPINPQTRLSEHGIACLGSPRNDHHVILAAAPTAIKSDDAAPLAAQILTGRIVRFASWVRYQIPADSAPHEMAEIFRQAAQVFLFPGLEEAARVKADIGEDDAGALQLMVTAHVAPSHAGAPFEMSFALPMR